MRDKKDRLQSKLFMKKLEILFEDEANILNRCIYCNKLFTNAQREWMICPRAKIFIDFRGRVIAQHVSDRSWDINEFVTYLRKVGVNWKSVYWKIWGRLVEYECTSCETRFTAAEFQYCSYHPQQPKFPFGSNHGKYPCCE